MVGVKGWGGGGQGDIGGGGQGDRGWHRSKG